MASRDRAVPCYRSQGAGPAQGVRGRRHRHVVGRHRGAFVFPRHRRVRLDRQLQRLRHHVGDGVHRVDPFHGSSPPDRAPRSDRRRRICGLLRGHRPHRLSHSSTRADPFSPRIRGPTAFLLVAVAPGGGDSDSHPYLAGLPRPTGAGISGAGSGHRRRRRISPHLGLDASDDDVDPPGLHLDGPPWPLLQRRRPGAGKGRSVGGDRCAGGGGGELDSPPLRPGLGIAAVLALGDQTPPARAGPGCGGADRFSVRRSDHHNPRPANPRSRRHPRSAGGAASCDG